MPQLLIVDDEESYRQVLSVIFAEEGYGVATAPGGAQALAHLAAHPCDVIISDVRMPDMDGIELLRRVRGIDTEIGVVLTTAFGTIETAREAFKLGADDFIQKPFNNDELKLIVRRAVERRTLLGENRAFRKAQRERGRITNLVGDSDPMRHLCSTIEAVAGERSTVLILGESGTGKELVARAIHDLSDRADKPFVPLNCGAMPEHLLEAELFGFVKGTFTGADRNRTGLFEAADGGTIFLDEIGDMPLAMQVKILRVLQDGRVRPVGASAEVDINTRVIAATHRDIRKMVEEGTFRRDLFYRLSVIPLHVPPLRDRRDDIVPLAEHFVAKFAARSGKDVVLPPATAALLRSRAWDGNVRELEHTIERAVALTPAGEIRAESLSDDFAGATPQNGLTLPADGLDLHVLLEKIERDMIVEALGRTAGNQTRAAALLGLAAHQFRHLAKKHEL